MLSFYTQSRCMALWYQRCTCSSSAPTALPNGNRILYILGIFASPLQAQGQESGHGRVEGMPVFWNSCRCLKRKGFFREAHLHLSYAVCAKACGVFVCWFDRLTHNGLGCGVAAPDQVVLMSQSSLKPNCLDDPWFFSALQRTRCFNVLVGFLIAFTIFFCYVVLKSKLRWNRDFVRLIISTKSFQNQPVLQMSLEVVEEIYGINVSIGIS